MIESSAEAPAVSVVIPNFNGAGFLPDCLDALEAQTFRDFNVVLVDDGSTDDSVSIARKRYPKMRVIELESNTGFASAVNAGIVGSRGDYVALLNNDTVAQPSWLGALVRTLERSAPEVGAVQSMMLQLQDPSLVDDAGDALSWFGAAHKLGHGRPASLFGGPREIFSPCAGAALYRRRFLEDVGGFDETFFAYLEDVDVGLRGRLLGYRYLLEPSAKVHHAGHGSAMPRGRYVRLCTRNRLILFGKSIPARLLLAHFARLLYGQFYFLVAYRRPLASLLGYVDFMRAVPHVLKERRKIAHHRHILRDELDGMLSTEMYEPPLRSLFARRVRRLFS